MFRRNRQAAGERGGISLLSVRPGDPQQEAPAAFCRRCRGEVYRGETLYFWEGRPICPDCFRLEVQRLLDTSPLLLAQDLGVGTCRLAGPGEGVGG